MTCTNAACGLLVPATDAHTQAQAAEERIIELVGQLAGIGRRVFE